MADMTISTSQVGNSRCPQMVLSVNWTSYADRVRFSWSLDYETYGYAFSSSSSPRVRAKANGSTVVDEGWSVGGEYSQNVDSGSFTVYRGKSAKSVPFELYWGMNGFTWSGSNVGNQTKTGSESVSALASYAVTYNANGGSGAPASQTKWYGETLTLSASVPSRADYNFVGWATTDTATSAVYQAGDSYTTNAGATLYAVWELAYVPPTISDLAAIRCDSAGNPDDSGTYAKVDFDWSIDTSIHEDNVLQSVELAYSVHGAESWTTVAVSASGTSGSVSQVIGTFATSTSYDIRATVTDAYGSTSMPVILSQAFFTVDFLAGGHGVAFGMAASSLNTYENGYENVHFLGSDYEYRKAMDGFIQDLLGARGTVLFESANGTNAAFTIGDYDFSDFDRVTIMYGKLDGNFGGYQSQTVYNPDGKRVVLSQSYAPVVSAGTVVQVNTSVWTLSGNTVTPSYNGRYANIYLYDGTVGGNQSGDGRILIYRVVGYSTKTELDAASGDYVAGNGISISGNVISADVTTQVLSDALDDYVPVVDTMSYADIQAILV